MTTYLHFIVGALQKVVVFAVIVAGGYLVFGDPLVRGMRTTFCDDTKDF
jgi:hypothetical protein